MQADITVSNGVILGKLKNVTGYTGFSDDPALQSGHFIALKFTAPEGATVKAGLVPSEGSGLVTLDSDMNGVWRLSDTKSQIFKTIVTASDGKATTKTFDISGLERE